MRYQLETGEWLVWTAREQFHALSEAERVGATISDEEWRIVDLASDRVVMQGSPFERLATEERQRFERTDYWRRFYAQRSRDLRREAELASIRAQNLRREEIYRANLPRMAAIDAIFGNYAKDIEGKVDWKTHGF